MTNLQLTHDFFHSDKRSARINSMSYSNDKFYSYSTVIGVKDDSKRVLFLCDSNYSNTTCKHKSHLARSNPYSLVIVDNVNNLKNLSNHQYFVNMFEERKNRLLNPRCKDKGYDIEVLQTIYKNYSKYLSFTDQQSNKNLTEMELFLQNINSSDFISVETEKMKELIKKQAEQKKIKALEDLQKWYSGEKQYLNSEFQYLRVISDNRIQTSKGYELPIDEFKRLYKIFKTRKENLLNESVNRSIKIDYVNDTKLIIGCHKVQFAEIERMNSLLEVSND